MSSARLYPFWADLTEALKTGKPQNEIKHTGKAMFDELYSDEARLEQFMHAMSGISTPNFAAFAQKFDFPNDKTLCDIDDARRENAFGLLMPLNMLIECGDAFDYSGADFAGWCRQAGFSRTEVIHLNGPCSAGVAYK